MSWEIVKLLAAAMAGCGVGMIIAALLSANRAEEDCQRCQRWQEEECRECRCSKADLIYGTLLHQTEQGDGQGE